MPAYLLSFSKGFRIGYRSPERMIPSVTLLRAVISVSEVSGDFNLLSSVLNGQIGLCMLPLASSNGYIKPLVPINLNFVARVFDLVAEKKGMSIQRKSERYSTLSASLEFVKALNASVSEGELPKIENLAGILGNQVNVKNVMSGEIIFYSRNEKLEDDVKVIIPRQVSEHRNIIDRLTGAATPFVVTYMQVSKLVLLAYVPKGLEQQLEKALALLGEIGVGGLRSRGLGRFTLEKIKLPPEDEQVLGKIVPITIAPCNRYALVFGELPLSWDAVKWKNSFFDLQVITGYAGPSYAQVLFGPLIVTRPGAVVKIGDCSKTHEVERIEIGERLLPSTFVFVPLVIVGE